MKAILLSLPLLALASFAVPPSTAAPAGGAKAEEAEPDLAKCTLRRDECKLAVRFCLDSGEELTCKQAQQICERVDPRCPQ